MNDRISIVSMASVSALGDSEDQIWQSYIEGKSLINSRDFGKFSALVSSISESSLADIEQLKSIKNYKDLDPSVLMAIFIWLVKIKMMVEGMVSMKKH